MLKRSQVSLLNDILSLVAITYEPPGQVVRRIDMRQQDFGKPPTPGRADIRSFM
jgi:hypothetical protein